MTNRDYLEKFLSRYKELLDTAINNWDEPKCEELYDSYLIAEERMNMFRYFGLPDEFYEENTTMEKMEEMLMIKCKMQKMEKGMEKGMEKAYFDDGDLQWYLGYVKSSLEFPPDNEYYSEICKIEDPQIKRIAYLYTANAISHRKISYILTSKKFSKEERLEEIKQGFFSEDREINSFFSKF